jgi:hypothetical protein
MLLDIKILRRIELMEDESYSFPDDNAKENWFVKLMKASKFVKLNYSLSFIF